MVQTPTDPGPRRAKAAPRRTMERFGAIPDEVLYAALDELPAEPFRLLALLYKLARGRDHVATTEKALAEMLSGTRRSVGVASVRRWVELLEAGGWVRRRQRGQGKQTVYVLPFTAYDRGTRNRFAHEPASPLKLERSKRGGWRGSPLKLERSNELDAASDAGLTAQVCETSALKYERPTPVDRSNVSGQATPHGDMGRDVHGDGGRDPAVVVRHPAKSARRAARQRGMAELGGLDEEVAELAPPTSTPARQQPGMPAPQIWAAALEELRRGGRVPEATERTWIANVEAAGYADGAIELVAPNTFALEWLETRFRPAIEAAVGRVAPGLGVAFVRRWEAAAG